MLYFIDTLPDIYYFVIFGKYARSDYSLCASLSVMFGTQTQRHIYVCVHLQYCCFLCNRPIHKYAWYNIHLVMFWQWVKLESGRNNMTVRLLYTHIMCMYLIMTSVLKRIICGRQHSILSAPFYVTTSLHIIFILPRTSS